MPHSGLCSPSTPGGYFFSNCWVALIILSLIYLFVSNTCLSDQLSPKLGTHTELSVEHNDEIGDDGTDSVANGEADY